MKEIIIHTLKRIFVFINAYFKNFYTLKNSFLDSKDSSDQKKLEKFLSDSALKLYVDYKYITPQEIVTIIYNNYLKLSDKTLQKYLCDTASLTIQVISQDQKSFEKIIEIYEEKPMTIININQIFISLLTSNLYLEVLNQPQHQEKIMPIYADHYDSFPQQHFKPDIIKELENYIQVCLQNDSQNGTQLTTSSLLFSYLVTRKLITSSFIQSFTDHIQHSLQQDTQNTSESITNKFISVLLNQKLVTEELFNTLCFMSSKLSPQNVQKLVSCLINDRLAAHPTQELSIATTIKKIYASNQFRQSLFSDLETKDLQFFNNAIASTYKKSTYISSFKVTR